MKFSEKVDQLFSGRIKDIGFLQLKEGTKAEIGDVVIDSDLLLPVVQEKIIKDIKEEVTRKEVKRLEDEINIEYIADGIINLLGIDGSFENNEIYKDILRAYNDRIEEYILYLAMTDLENNKLIDAGIKFRALLELNPNYILAIFNYALVIEALSDKEDGVDLELLSYSTRLFESILNKDEEFELAYYKLGYHYLYNQQYLKASLMWEKYINKSKDDLLIQSIREELTTIDNEVLMESALTYIAYGDYNKALTYLEKLLPNNKNEWNVNFMLGKVYAGIGEYDLSKDYYERSIELNPSNVDIYNELGIMYINLGLLDESIEIFNKGIDASAEEDYKILFNRGLAYNQIGEDQKALEDLYRVKEIGPDHLNIDEVIEEMKKI